MASSKSFGHLLAALTLVAALAACGTNTGTAGRNTSPPSSTTDATGVPSTVPYPDPTTGVPSITPQEPIYKPAVQVGGPPPDGNTPEFTPKEPRQCGVFLFGTDLDEVITVGGLSIGPSEAFVRDDGACDEIDGELCPGYEFRPGDGECYFGVRWDDTSGVQDGIATLDFSATCHDRVDELCRQLTESPDADGTEVVFTEERALHGHVPDPSDDDPPDAKSSISSAPESEDDGDSSSDEGSSSAVSGSSSASPDPGN
jgi:hypothetical protein